MNQLHLHRMGYLPVPVSLQRTISLVCFVLFLQNPLPISSDYTTLVYKICSNQTFQDPFSYSLTLSSLYQDLVAHSSHSKFFKTSAGDEAAAVFGLFQCRGDLSADDCSTCVSELSSNIWCAQSSAARVQLGACYMSYEADGFDEISVSESAALYWTCGEAAAAAVRGRETARDAAFAEAESGVGGSEGLFYGFRVYGGVGVMAQCEEDMGRCECGECVGSAVEIGREACGSSASGQVYMDKCFLSFSDFDDEILTGDGQGKQGGNNVGKVAAIAAAGIAALFLGSLFLKFIIKSLADKDY
ncbi:plasmodesmata-located protein 2-like [Malania oleifera]|uniref:plasmodesmata-located protein 2-like n=1 Tax=Malania oleifera TaxID=397392 RepID=UPI0025AE188D|nr:plasmodesmata-located protein 2-like [Malania oleifera]